MIDMSARSSRPSPPSITSVLGIRVLVLGTLAWVAVRRGHARTAAGATASIVCGLCAALWAGTALEPTYVAHRAPTSFFEGDGSSCGDASCDSAEWGESGDSASWPSLDLP